MTSRLGAQIARSRRFERKRALRRLRLRRQSRRLVDDRPGRRRDRRRRAAAPRRAAPGAPSADLLTATLARASIGRARARRRRPLPRATSASASAGVRSSRAPPPARRATADRSPQRRKTRFFIYDERGQHAQRRRQLGAERGVGRAPARGWPRGCAFASRAKRTPTGAASAPCRGCHCARRVGQRLLDGAADLRGVERVRARDWIGDEHAGAARGPVRAADARRRPRRSSTRCSSGSPLVYV